MQWTTLDDVRITLDETINGKLCVQTWLGYAQVLFIGFGDNVLPIPSPGEPHPMPPYEIETGFADWRIENHTGNLGTSQDDQTKAEAVAALLVGHRLISWNFIDSSVALEFEFDNGMKLKMSPYADKDVSNENAWCLRTIEYYGLIDWNGTMKLGRCDE